MTIEIDLELLKTTNLSPDEFIGLYLTLRKGYSYLDELNLNIDWIALEEKGYITIEPLGTHTIEAKFKELFSNNFDALFEELISTYPHKVDTKGGVRILHAVDPKSKSNVKAKLKYRKIVGNNLHVHTKIISLLKVQLKIEEDNLAYLQNLETWLNNHTWEKYENITNNNGKSNTQRITRSL